MANINDTYKARPDLLIILPPSIQNNERPIAVHQIE